MKKIALGSIRTKLLSTLPVALLLTHFLPMRLVIILMLGGIYLAFEDAEKVWDRLSGAKEDETPAVMKGPEAIALAGTVAMLWVDGYILLVNLGNQ
ncbi:DUF808 family protein [Halomonas sp. HMF6819]|uniref:DUF808 family protein n=1 Tax=Halomonas sp. HMF6819 TaxID=3373085 RepID=UPI003799F3E5